jgi:hypothetical protein
MTPFRGQSGVARSSTTTTAYEGAARNKFAGRWSSQIKNASDEVFDDGVIDISDATNADEVSVSHSVRGGPVIGHTMGYPDRIEIQILLGNDRVAHYNGVLVSATKIEGRYFMTGRPKNHHSRSRLIIEEDGSWTAEATIK